MFNCTSYFQNSKILSFWAELWTSLFSKRTVVEFFRLILNIADCTNFDDFSALSIELFNGTFYLLAVWRILRVCRINPRRIKTSKFDEDDYLLNGIVFGPLVNDIYYLTVGLFYSIVRNTNHYDQCMAVINIPNIGEQDIFSISMILVFQRKVSSYLRHNFLQFNCFYFSLILTKVNFKTL